MGIGRLAELYRDGRDVVVSAVDTAPDCPYSFPRVVPVTSCACLDPLISVLVSAFDQRFESSRVEWRTKYHSTGSRDMWFTAAHTTTLVRVACIGRALLGFVVLIKTNSIIINVKQQPGNTHIEY